MKARNFTSVKFQSGFFSASRKSRRVHTLVFNPVSDSHWLNNPALF